MATHLHVRQLGPGDGHVLETLAREEAEFDIDGRGAPLPPLSGAEADAYLVDPSVLHWVVEDGDTVVGDLLCHVLRLSGGDSVELLLYEIGVRASHRRQGVGRLLLSAMEKWMAEHRVAEVWVLADNPDAEAFYQACGFARSDPQPVYMTRRSPGSSPGK